MNAAKFQTKGSDFPTIISDTVKIFFISRAQKT